MDPIPAQSYESADRAVSRGKRVLQRLFAQPERIIAVVSHSWLMGVGIFGSHVVRVEVDTAATPNRGKPLDRPHANCETRPFAMRRVCGDDPMAPVQYVARPVQLTDLLSLSASSRKIL
eukprot:gnl/TRDRNA2_/TRDRNA2_93510_c0_seq1.p1 gnl/TRDRNA2_/TRDRNA2_93510_c0~~gnl/TRDRNA2_/TRDRNA2_93510_c0_seq1.p1  ORF type:complete len:119 (+),score=6.77 gnl/TRDRNA2_/TRDRNA2_93510_c0_seq1:3-359(+)